jgi:alpha-glucuronidase
VTTVHKILAPLARVLPVDPAATHGEDGYDLWLRYRPLDTTARARLFSRARSIVLPQKASLTVLAAAAELNRALEAMLGRAPPIARGKPGEGALVLATPKSFPAIAALELPLAGLGNEGYVVRAVRLGGKKVTLIAANTDSGLLYGTFGWLRAVLTGRDVAAIDEVSAPKVGLRVLNHWDNLDRSVERGYAGESIWDWWRLPVTEQRYVDYARATASLGINGVSLNNVNASAVMLTSPWIAKAAALANVFRPYRIRVYLAVRFSAPVELGELATADPLDGAVRAWWKKKADEIYRAMPDFGGFLVKANSEGQPGPHDYGRDHAEGANMLADSLARHGGVVFWRAFVYSQHDPEDRAKQAFRDFKALDGRFAPNVVVQVKNGPIDFQPREPFHPMFGGLSATPLALEFQVTKEYLGFATHLVYLGTMYEEVLRSDTYATGGPGTKVSATIAAMAAVGNVGSHRTWSGSHFDQANWYAFGRLAWNPDATARDIAAEWAALTFTTNPRARRAIVDLMMRSHEALVSYMTPLGLHHIMDTGHHHGPGPWVSDLARPEWNPTYYHRADRGGIGFDRTSSGSNAVSQYAPALAKILANPRTTPEKWLLWFHHLPWDYRMPSGRTLWHEIVHRYDQGVAAAKDLRRRWKKLEGDIDARRFSEVSDLLEVQVAEAQWWRDACVAYFSSVSGLPLPPRTQAPPLALSEYQARKFPFAPGRG